MRLHHEYLPATSATQQELVRLHGWGCNREVWRPLLMLLRPWANITLLDLPGCAPGSSLGKEAELAGLLSQHLDRLVRRRGGHSGMLPGAGGIRGVVAGWAVGYRACST